MKREREGSNNVNKGNGTQINEVNHNNYYYGMAPLCSCENGYSQTITTTCESGFHSKAPDDEAQ